MSGSACLQSAVVRCKADVHIKLCCMELLRVYTRDNVEEVHSAPLKAHDHWSMHEDIYSQSTTVQFTGWCVLGTHPHAQGTSQCVSWPHHVRLQEQKQKDAHCNAQSMRTCHTTQPYTAEPHAYVHQPGLRTAAHHTNSSVHRAAVCVGSDLPYLSITELFISPTMALGCASFSLNMLSMTEISALVVSIPQNAVQSLTASPAPITSLPLFTEPACSVQHTHHRLLRSLTIQENTTVREELTHTTIGTCSSEESSSCSAVLVFGCTCAVKQPAARAHTHTPSRTCTAG